MACTLKCSSSSCIFLASSGSANMKNDNIHSVFLVVVVVAFFAVFVKMLNLPALLQNKNTQVGPFPWKRSVLQIPDRERTNQSTGICLKLSFPYNNIGKFLFGRFFHLFFFFDNKTKITFSAWNGDGRTSRVGGSLSRQPAGFEMVNY